MTRTEKQTMPHLPIGRILLIAFIAMPLIEIAVLINVGGWLGLWPTLALIVLTAIVGTWMLRRQGFAVMTRAQQRFAEGKMPLDEIFEGFCLVISGALLLTPGFVTDAIGGLLLIPSVRGWLYRRLRSHFQVVTAPRGDGSAEGPVVDGDYEPVSPDNDEPVFDQEGTDDKASRTVSSTLPPPRGGWGGKS
jgi:UPF0716 protein FxsA